MTIRSLRERVLQTTIFEVVGVLGFTPLVTLVMDETAANSMGLLIALSLAAVTVAGVFNHAYDWVEFKKTGRVASDRPTRWRIVHAVMFECVVALATLPIIKFGLDLPWVEALAADAVLLLLYAGYGYIFHIVYDRLRPVRPELPDGFQAAHETIEDGDLCRSSSAVAD